MTEFERICVDEKPDLVTVVGDVNSTIACALVARKLHIDVAHIESGLRSNDESMPEEINRILTDRISNLLFVSEQAGIDNLLKEGINPDKIYHSGNIMIDTLVNNLPHITAAKTYKKYDLSPQKYGVLTLHRPKNVDTQKELTHSLDIILEVQKLNTLIWPMHPRTKKNIQKYGLHEKINELTNVVFTEPLGYHDFMSLIKNSQFVLTDSGGIQEESTYLRIPCITLRENTERPSTVELGTNVITGLDKELILKYHNQIITDQYKQGSRPIFWDGNTAKRIVNTIVEKYV